jgi:cobalt-precorrin 5A hydrolase/precorrin-3B C17-methyltransferase
MEKPPACSYFRELVLYKPPLLAWVRLNATHFCAISLSDLLTPWETIEKRLTAAAQADFITALYNPKSQTRTQQLATATAIFLQYRDPNTPVAIVRSAYRPDEQLL